MVLIIRISFIYNSLSFLLAVKAIYIRLTSSTRFQYLTSKINIEEPILYKCSILLFGQLTLIILFTLPLEDTNSIITINNYFTFFITLDRLSQVAVKSSFISFKLSPKTVTSPVLTLWVN